MDISTDLILIILPFYVFSTMSFKGQRKTAVIALFFVRIVVIIPAIYRLKSMDTASFKSGKDLSWTIVPFLIYTCLHMNLSIICCTIPCVRPFLRSLESGFMDAGLRKTSSPRYASSIANGDHSRVLATLNGWNSKQPSPITRSFGPSTQQATTLQASTIGTLDTTTDPVEEAISYLEVPTKALGQVEDDLIAFLKGLRPDFHDYESFVTRSVPQIDGPSRSRLDALLEAEQALKNNPEARMSIVKTVGYKVQSEQWPER
jgi:hypothetical protein